jgi:hypothetical protein
LALLGNQKLLSKISPASWSPTRKGLASLIFAFLVITIGVVSSFFLLGSKEKKADQNEAVYNSALEVAWNWVDGSEAAPLYTKPPWLNDLKVSGPKSADLASGLEQFLDFRFEEALTSFQKLTSDSAPDHRILSLLAATNLRLLNYGQAKTFYTQSLSLLGTPPEKGGLKEASDRLGLALALFHQQEYEQSLHEAGISWRLRHQLLGAADSKTLAAVNSMSTSLMALSRSAIAGDLLLEAVAQAIENGADQNQPVMRDSLSILFLAFEAQGRGDELRVLFQDPESPAATATEAPSGTLVEAPSGTTSEPSSAAEAEAPSGTAVEVPSETRTESTFETTGPKAPPAQEETRPTATAQGAPSPTEPAPPVASKPSIDQIEAKKLIEYLKTNHPNSRVLPALALALAGALTGPTQPACRSPYPAKHFQELLSLCLDVAKGYASANALKESSSILSDLSETGLAALNNKVDVSKAKLIEALALLAGEMAELQALTAAEKALKEARDVAATLPLADQQGLTSLIILSLRLSDIVLAQKKPPIEAELELVAGLTTIKKLYKSKVIEEHPLSAVLYLRLAWLVGSMGRNKDARAYQDLTSRSLKASAKAHPELKTSYTAVTTAFEEHRKRKTNQDTLAYLWRPILPANRPPQPPASPEIMREELAALKLLNRLPDFKKLIDSALKWSSETHGADSSLHRRYQSLNLKYLEESGNIPALTEALDSMAANPGTTQEPDRTAVIISALKYKARVLERVGQKFEALEALSQAKIIIADTNILSDKLLELNAEINRLSADPN